MHVAFALMLGIPLFQLVRNRVIRYLWLLYPALVTFVVVSTANHFVLDAVFGAATAAISAWTAQALLARARPHAWAFHEAPA
jgi:hypothetical protein